MATTVTETFALFGLFVCFVALCLSQPILPFRDITSILCEFYPTLGFHDIRNILKLQPQPIFLSQPKMTGNIYFCAACLKLQKDGQEGMWAPPIGVKRIY